MKITQEIIFQHGLTDEEYQRILSLLGRDPNFLELGIFSVMWSEHCSYKSSKIHLKNFPITGKHVLQGPGENAGIVDIGDGMAVAFKMESHNHPSYIEPYQGAATGVGGILRDIFTMGARPIASLNSLRFGSFDHPKTRYLLNGVVAGIAGYGNCMGVPTVGGEVYFHESYNGNCLVNAMTVGIMKSSKIFKGKAEGIGNLVMYVGSKTGRDGIHGATMASDVFGEGGEERRPTVQVGDPFTEKLLLEACLEVFKTDYVVGIQDMGAAGLTSSSVEMASRGGTGIDLDVSLVPRREDGMTPYEVMLSESQERMLMVVKNGCEEKVREIFHKWDLEAVVVGVVTNSNLLRVADGNNIVAIIPVKFLTDNAPVYKRPIKRPDWQDDVQTIDLKNIPEPAVVVGGGGPAKERQGPANPPTNIDAALDGVVRDFILLWAKNLNNAGIPKEKIYTHVAYIDEETYAKKYPLNAIEKNLGISNPSYSALGRHSPFSTAFNDYSRPGFSTYPVEGMFDAIYRELANHPKTGWASSEGANVLPGADASADSSGINMETYLARMFNHGATLVNIFAWGMGGDAFKNSNPFRIATEGPEAIAAYRKFLNQQ